MPIGEIRSITRGVLSLTGPFRDRLEILHFHLQAAIGIQRRQVVEIDAMAHRVGRLEIDLSTFASAK